MIYKPKTTYFFVLLYFQSGIGVQNNIKFKIIIIIIVSYAKHGLERQCYLPIVAKRSP